MYIRVCVERIASTKGLDDLGITTNGIILYKIAADLKVNMCIRLYIRIHVYKCMLCLYITYMYVIT